MGDCAAICNNFSPSNWALNGMACVSHAAGTAVDTPNGQANAQCGDSFTPEIDICQVSMNVQTSGSSETYMEVWLPSSDNYNGRTMSTDNGGVNGCVHYVDMSYVSGMGFAAIGDNAGHNGSSFDGTWMLNANEKIVDWADRARHASVEIGKEVVSQYYGNDAAYSYYIGCSAGGQQGLHSAMYHPDDFDGIISGAPSNDFQNLQGWSARFIQLTGTPGDDTFLTKDQWILVQSQIQEECDEALDGVADGILEDPTICNFNASALNCDVNDDSRCLTATQVTTVEKVFTPLFNTDGQLLYPALLPGSQVDAFSLGQLSGNVQGIARDFFRAVHNDSSFDVTTVGQADYRDALNLDQQMGYPSSFNADLSGFRNSNGKMILYHGLADPLTSGANSQRFYLKVADRMGLDHTEIDSFMRYFRISGMAHCGVGGIAGAGAWMFGQNKAASDANTNIVNSLVDWVENSNAPDTLEGTKFWWDEPANGIQFTRNHCRFPYRNTFTGNGDGSDPADWRCEMIDDWRECGVDVMPRLCNADGTFGY